MNIDVVVVGAGFSGIYMLHKLNKINMKAVAIEEAEDVGGVWYWNRYPGARCDSEAYHYNFTFSEKLYKKWDWSAKYAEQPEILDYLKFVADELNVREKIKFSTKVEKARYIDNKSKWEIHLDNGQILYCKYFITGVGNISKTFIPNFKGLSNFKGETYHTGSWLENKVDFKSKRVGVIGTGSSGVQCIPVIAKEAKELFVFQRTPNYIIPANNYKFSECDKQKMREKYHTIRQGILESDGGTPYRKYDKNAKDDSPENIKSRLEDAWEKGGIFPMNNSYKDVLTDEESNKIVADFVRGKIKEKIKKEEIINDLLPDHFYNAKRTITDSYYFETLNEEHVHLINVNKSPIKHITENGIQLENDEHIHLDTIVFATGYDGITGNLFNLSISGKDGINLKDKWDNGENTTTNLGMMTNSFPNLFFITGPQTPAVLTNIPATIEQNVEWIAQCIEFSEKNNLESIEPTIESEENWRNECYAIAQKTLYIKTKSWYIGANIPGKPINIQIYMGGLKKYREECEKEIMSDFPSFIKVKSRQTVKDK